MTRMLRFDKVLKEKGPVGSGPFEELAKCLLKKHFTMGFVVASHNSKLHKKNQQTSSIKKLFYAENSYV